METNFTQEDLARLNELREIEEAGHRNLQATNSRSHEFMDALESHQQAAVALSELETKLRSAHDLWNVDTEQRRV